MFLIVAVRGSLLSDTGWTEPTIWKWCRDVQKDKKKSVIPASQISGIGS